MYYDSTWVNIDLDAISDNFDAICAKAGAPVMAIIKADAYGHGAVPVARLLENRSAFFGVSSMTEALELRRAGIRIPRWKPTPMPSGRISALPFSIMRTHWPCPLRPHWQEKPPPSILPWIPA